MMNLLESYGVDLKKADEGVKMKLSNGAWLKLRRWHNEDFTRRMAEEVSRLSETLFDEDGNIPEEDDRRITNLLIAETIIVDWGGIAYPEKEVPYSKEVALKILEDERMAEFRKDLMAFSKARPNYRITAKVVKN